MGKIYKKLNVSEDTFNLIMIDCKNEFLRHNPKFKGMNLTQDFIVDKIGEYYKRKFFEL